MPTIEESVELVASVRTASTFIPQRKKNKLYPKRKLVPFIVLETQTLACFRLAQHNTNVTITTG